MKIYVLGSNAFVREMVASVDELKKLGHEGWIHPHYVDYVNQENHPHFSRFDNGEHAQVKIENDYLNQHYQHILESDAVLVINNEKHGVASYIGGNVLIEMGQAYVNGKKIFLLNSIPDMNYTEEIVALKPISLEGDLSRIPLGNDSSRSDLKFIGEEANKIEDELDLNIDDVLNKLTQEFGEFNDCVQKVRGRYCRNKEKDNSHLEEELGDLIFNLVSVCNRMGVDSNKFSSFARNTLEKFKARKEDYKHD